MIICLLEGIANQQMQAGSQVCEISVDTNGEEVRRICFFCLTIT